MRAMYGYLRRGWSRKADRPLLDLPACGPNIIGATGGSGTRVVARIARCGGMFIGTNLNESADALGVAAFDDRWAKFFARDDAMSSLRAFPKEMIIDFEAMLACHRASIATATQPWGWKHPPSIYLVPFYHQQFPLLKFLHVIRDGRDMAYSTNQNQLQKFGSAALTSTESEWSQPLRSMALWSRVNLHAAEYGDKHLHGQYLVVRFEDLCSQPVPTTKRILTFFGLSGDAEEIAEHEITPPESMGRWKSQDTMTVEQMQRIGGAALRKFGYPVP